MNCDLEKSFLLVYLSGSLIITHGPRGTPPADSGQWAWQWLQHRSKVAFLVVFTSAAEVSPENHNCAHALEKRLSCEMQASHAGDTGMLLLLKGKLNIKKGITFVVELWFRSFSISRFQVKIREAADFCVSSVILSNNHSRFNVSSANITMQ